MSTITLISGIAAFLDRDNVDTDAILPKQFMKSIKRTGYGQFAFDEWRYLDKGKLGMDCSARPINPNFALNQPTYQGASILITRSNFGCGSSREHAPWALGEYGFRAIVAESFADIFRTNCLRNRIAPIELNATNISALFCQAATRTTISIDLENQLVQSEIGTFQFHLTHADRARLIQGLDEISLTLQATDKIRAFERKRFEALPWLDSHSLGREFSSVAPRRRLL